MTEEQELRLECLKSASYLMAHKPITMFNKKTKRYVDSPIVLADSYVHFVKNGLESPYLNDEDMTVSPHQATTLETKNADSLRRIEEYLVRRESKGFLRRLLKL